MQLKIIAILVLFFSLSIHAHAAPKEWNVLVFINGVNDLDSYGAMNINQMETVGSNSDVNILVQWGSLNFSTIKRVLIQKDNDQSRVTSPVVQDIGQVDMGDHRELVKFVKWANENYPAKHFMVIVWNHGTGWHGLSQDIRPMDISLDERTGNSIDTAELGTAMKESAKIIGHNVDIYASDACLMGMIEIAAEMADSVDYFVGSQDLEPGEGWSYGTFLGSWMQAGAKIPAAEVAKIASIEFLKAYSRGGTYGENLVTMSAFDLSKIDLIYDAVGALGQHLSGLSSSNLRTLQTTAGRSKSFSSSDYVDMKNFFDLAPKSLVPAKLMADLESAMKEFVIANDQNQDQNSHGISIWLPSDEYLITRFGNTYEPLRFNQETDWLNFLTKVNQ